MKNLLFAVGICTVVVGGLAAPGAARADTEVGLGLYQGSSFSPAVAYGSISAWIEDQAVLSFGLMVSTVEPRSFGFYTRFGYKIGQRDRVRVLLGGTLEVADAPRDDIVGFGPFIGLDARLADNFSVIADGYPFQIVANGDAEAIFFDGRLGAAFWF